VIRVGVDVGNSGCKVAAFDEDGSSLRLARREYTFTSSRPGWRELDAEQVLGSVLDCLTEVCSDGLGRRVGALAVSAQGEALVPMDEAGRVLAPVQASFDERSAPALDRVYAQLDGARLEATTGNPRHAIFSLYKLLGIRDQDPALFRRIRRVATFADWTAHRLGAPLVMDHSQASRTSLLDVRERRWSDWILDAVDLDGDLLPPLAPGGTAIGTVAAAVAERTGLSPQAVIATGGHDQICCALGAGVTAVGQAMNSMGTTDSLVCLTPSFDGAGRIAAGGNAIGLGATADYAVHGYVLSTGSATAWFARTFRTDGADLDTIARRGWDDGRPTGIHFLPHLTGSGTPHLDALSRGAFLGLTTEATPERLYRAVLEGICLELRENLEHLAQAGARIDTLTVVGGAAASTPYLQTKADIFGIPVRRSAVHESGCAGAALLAGRAVGRHDDAPPGSPGATDLVVEPDPDRHAAYAQMADEHARLYRLTRELDATR
jgi:xylulokinase